MPGGTECYYPHFANLYRWQQIFQRLSFMKKIILIFVLIQGTASHGQSVSSKKYDKEPPSSFEVSVNGKIYFISEDEELTTDTLIGAKIKIKQSQYKKFENSSYSFEYPQNLSFQYTEEASLRTWVLTGNSVIIMLFEMDVRSTLDNFAKEITEKFGIANCKIENSNKTLGNKSCVGKTITVTFAGQSIIYECYSFQTDNDNSRFIFLQDSLEELAHTKEYHDILTLLNETILYK